MTLLKQDLLTVTMTDWLEVVHLLWMKQVKSKVTRTTLLGIRTVMELKISFR